MMPRPENYLSWGRYTQNEKIRNKTPENSRKLESADTLTRKATRRDDV